MVIRIRNNRAFLSQINLGSAFLEMSADATVDQYGRVQVYLPPATRIPSFYTSVDRLPTNLLRSLCTQLEDVQATPPLTKLLTTIRASLETLEA